MPTFFPGLVPNLSRTDARIKKMKSNQNHAEYSRSQNWSSARIIPTSKEIIFQRRDSFRSIDTSLVTENIWHRNFRIRRRIEKDLALDILYKMQWNSMAGRGPMMRPSQEAE